MTDRRLIVCRLDQLLRLTAGIRFSSRALRLVSALLVLMAVAKMVLYDMRQLEGVLRALSSWRLAAC